MKKNNQLIKNLLISDDNLKALNDLKMKGIKADLIYLDPPFFSHRYYEVVWGDEAEIRSFKDRWAGGINVYIEWMRERVVKMYDVLKDTGTFYLHCDWHASHYLKVMLDEIFGYEKFLNEIVWAYFAFKRKTAKKFPMKHDTLFSWTKTDSYVWNTQYKPHKKEYLKRWKKDKDGRYYRDDVNPTKGGTRTIYLDDVEGDIVDSVWDDIHPVNPMAKERAGYPTQKPERLLERIIKASSNKGDLVLDPFCGCGTAMAMAQKLGRKWLGIDISPTAISIVEKRLGKLGAVKSKDFDVIGMPTTISELKALEPFEFQNWVINEMKAKQSKRLVKDMGINGYYEKTIFTDEAGIQVKQSEKVGRNVVDNFETALRRKKHEKGFIVAFSFTKDAHEEVARVKRKGLDIKLTKVEDLLLGRAEIFKG